MTGRYVIANLYTHYIKLFIFRVQNNNKDHKSFLYKVPPQSLNFAAACSGVISLCGSAINS